MKKTYSFLREPESDYVTTYFYTFLHYFMQDQVDVLSKRAHTIVIISPETISSSET